MEPDPEYDAVQKLGPNPSDTRLPRTAAEWIDTAVRDANAEYRHLMDDPAASTPVPDDASRWHQAPPNYMILNWIAAYLWAALARVDAEAADVVALDISNACDAGDAFGEWAYQWAEDLLAGRPLTLPAFDRNSRSR